MWKEWTTRPRLRPDWEPRLNAWLEGRQDHPHQWGEHDCLLQPAGAIEAQTGRDFAEGHRGKYRSANGATRYLRTLGFRMPAQLLDSILDRVPPAFAQRGDIALVKLPDLPAVPAVIIGGEALALVHGFDQPLRVPRQFWTRAWSVGRRTVGAGE